MVLDLKNKIATDAYTNPDERGNPIPILDQARVEIREGKGKESTPRGRGFEATPHRGAGDTAQ